jgi:tetratricopeptide (TPR) repeat protein
MITTMRAVFVWVLLAANLRAADDPLLDAINNGRFKEALATADSLLKAQPRDARLWTARGVALGGLGRSEASLSSFDQALKISPGLLPALKGAAETAYRSRDSRASGYLAKILLADPKNDVANAMLGVLAFEGQNCSQALKYFDNSRALVERDPVATSQYGACLVNGGRAGDAVPIFQRALAANPTSINTRYNLAVSLLKAGRAEDAVETLRPLSEDAAALNLRAAAESAAGRLEDAIASLRTASRLAPTDERNYIDFAVLCLEHDNSELAEEVATAGLKNIPGSARLYSVRGLVRALRGQQEQAATDFDKASELEPGRAYGAVGQSVLLRQGSRIEEAIAVLRRKLRAAPDDPILNYMLADVLLRQSANPGTLSFVEARKALERSTDCWARFT